MRSFLPWPVLKPLALRRFCLAFVSVVLSCDISGLSRLVRFGHCFVPVVSLTLLPSLAASPL